MPVVLLIVRTGYCRFDHVRIPRKNMLAKFSFVTEVRAHTSCRGEFVAWVRLN
jgi:hypothetical protein